jgi:hypothetical protein
MSPGGVGDRHNGDDADARAELQGRLLELMQREVEIKQQLIGALPAAWQVYLLPVSAQLDQLAASIRDLRDNLATTAR